MWINLKGSAFGEMTSGEQQFDLQNVEKV